MGGEGLESEDENIPQAPYAQRLEEISNGDKITVLTREGREGIDGTKTVIGRLADGRVILFSRDSTLAISAHDTVQGEVVYVHHNYIIVLPSKVMGDTTEALLENLNHVARSGYYQHAVLAKALLYLLSKSMEG